MGGGAGERMGGGDKPLAKHAATKSSPDTQIREPPDVSDAGLRPCAHFGKVVARAPGVVGHQGLANECSIT